VASPTTPLRRCASCGTAIAVGVLSCPVCGADAPTEITPAETVAFSLPDDGIGKRRAAIQGAIGPDFEIRRRIGRGGFGEVWEAFDLRLGRSVAIKILREDLTASAAFRERFRRETRAVAKMRHPGIVPVYHVGEEEDLVYFIMPLVEGVTLKAALEREGRLSTAEAVRILSEASDALREAHRRGIVHRDLKPENVMLEGAERRVLLMDFGIAQSEEGDRELTGVGLVLGSPEYMSPEQAMGSRHLDGRSDIYSLGVVGYRMLAGRLPFLAETAREALAHHVATPPDPLEAVAPVPAGVAAAVMRCLAKRPEDRFQTTDELLAALRPTVRFASSPSLPALAAEESEVSHTTSRAVAVSAPPPPPPAEAAAAPRTGRRALLIWLGLLGAAAVLWGVHRVSERRRWEGVAVAVEDAYRQATDSLHALAAGFRSGALGAPAYLAAAEGLQRAVDAGIAERFGPVLEDRAAMPRPIRVRADSALHAAWAATLPGAVLTLLPAGAAGCVTRQEDSLLVMADSSSGDNCWWSLSAPPPMTTPLEYALTFHAPTRIPDDAGVGLAWCPAAAACRVVFVWLQGRLEVADHRPGVGLRRREISGRLAAITGEQRLRVRVEADRVRTWLGGALVFDRPSAADAALLAQGGALRLVVQNAAVAVGTEDVVVVGRRP
jgi:tRNA A-37 threonylcarbamoyl transferase component Bud32